MKKSDHTEKIYRFRGKAAIAIMAALLCCVILASLRCGTAQMDNETFWNALIRKKGFETQTVILYLLRIPRLAEGILAGIGLSVSGVLLQNVTGNSLASPNIIGVNSGAGLAVILLLYFFPSAVLSLPFAAFAGAFVTTLFIIYISEKIGGTKMTIILAGIACTAMLNAGISFISLLDSDVLVSYNYFSAGGFNSTQLKKLIIPAVIILSSLFVSLLFSSKIDLLCLGDSTAVSLGVRVKRLRMICLICASASAAAVVSFAGLLGFVGLIVPHITRRLTGNNAKYLLVCSSFIGSIIVLAADWLGRVLFAPSEIPVGIIMALIGAPFFFVLLLRRNRI